jgi:hypothetical protein
MECGPWQVLFYSIGPDGFPRQQIKHQGCGVKDQKQNPFEHKKSALGRSASERIVSAPQRRILVFPLSLQRSGYEWKGHASHHGHGTEVKRQNGPKHPRPIRSTRGVRDIFD